MSNLITIVKKHYATFYRYDSLERIAVWPRFLFIAIFSVLLVLLMKDISDNIIGAVLTVQSILVGFSFSVLFFLLSSNAPTMEKTSSIEKSLKHERIIKLSRELFFNVSYFNLVAILSVFFSVIFLLPDFDYQTILTPLTWFPNLLFLQSQEILKTANILINIVSATFEFLLYFLFIESMVTFARTIGRVGFYFEQKLSLEQVPETD